MRVADQVYRYVIPALTFAALAAIAPPYLVSFPPMLAVWRALTSIGRRSPRTRSGKSDRAPLSRRLRRRLAMEVRRRGRVMAYLKLARRGVERAYRLVREFSYSPVIAALSLAEELLPSTKARKWMGRARGAVAFAMSPYRYARSRAIRSGKRKMAALGWEEFSLRGWLRERLRKVPTVKVPEDLREIALSTVVAERLGGLNPVLAERARVEADLGVKALILADLQRTAQSLGLVETLNALQDFDIKRAGADEVESAFERAMAALDRDLMLMSLTRLYDLAQTLSLASASFVERLLDRYASPSAPMLPYFLDTEYLEAVRAVRDELLAAFYANIADTAVPDNLLARTAALRDVARRLQESSEEVMVALRQARALLEKAEREAIKGRSPLEEVATAAKMIEAVASRLREMTEEAHRASINSEAIEEAREHLLAIAACLRKLLGEVE